MICLHFGRLHLEFVGIYLVFFSSILVSRNKIFMSHCSQCSIWLNLVRISISISLAESVSLVLAMDLQFI